MMKALIHYKMTPHHMINRKILQRKIENRKQRRVSGKECGNSFNLWIRGRIQPQG
ncbi:hypothetical cytosolic protein [Syntrophus aciditrophicus SB]|uniref:Hypothetical cytosolic protein n=1 Tax=Syntrophus aciditrophicus (strain SB) TaxID=56780 RepID=Q2LUN2_SYNAS|nr:hypothetical cytosolic protein [Syntrophus aciditrophicus SB]